MAKKGDGISFEADFTGDAAFKAVEGGFKKIESAIGKMAEKLAASLEKMKDFTKQVTQDTKAAIKSYENLITKIEQVKSKATVKLMGADKFRSTIQALADSIANMNAAVTFLKGGLAGLTPSLAGVEVKVNATDAVFRRLSIVIRVFKKAITDLNTTLSSMSQILRISATANSAIAASLENAGNTYNKITNITKNYVRAANEAREATVKYSDSWKMFTSTLASQTVARLFQMFVMSTRQSIEAAVDFERHIAEIQTITQKASMGFESWADGLRNLSDAFGIDVLEMAEGTYEAISNQVVRGGESFYFMAEAAKFAQTTVSTVKQSVDLLTAAINAYGLSSLHAADVSSTFFAVIEVGRVRAEQLGNVMGTTANLAAQLGISMDDLGTSIAMLTTQGTLPNTALTLMSNIVLKLVKPSDEMAAIFKKWGVNSGEAAVATFGFQGVLQKLGQEFQDGGIAEMADVFKDMRAIRGISGLLAGTTLGSFDDVKARVMASKESYEMAKQIIKDPAYYKYNKTMNEMVNLFTTDFGRGIVETFNRINDAVGGFVPTLQLLMDSLSAFAAPFGVVLDTVGALVNLLKTVDTATGGWGYTIMGMAIPAIAAYYGALGTLKAAGLAWVGTLKMMGIAQTAVASRTALVSAGTTLAGFIPGAAAGTAGASTLANLVPTKAPTAAAAAMTAYYTSMSVNKGVVASAAAGALAYAAALKAQATAALTASTFMKTYKAAMTTTVTSTAYQVLPMFDHLGKQTGVATTEKLVTEQISKTGAINNIKAFTAAVVAQTVATSKAAWSATVMWFKMLGPAGWAALIVGGLAAVTAAIAGYFYASKRAEQARLTKKFEEDAEAYERVAQKVVKEGNAFKEASEKKLSLVLQLGAAMRKYIDLQSGRGEDNTINYQKSLNASLEDSLRIHREMAASFEERNRKTRNRTDDFTTTITDAKAAIAGLGVELGKAFGPGQDRVKNAAQIRDLYTASRKEIEALNDFLDKSINKSQTYLAAANKAFAERLFDQSLAEGAAGIPQLEAEVRRIIGEAGKVTDPQTLQDMLSRAQELAEKVTSIQSKDEGFTGLAAIENEVLAAKNKLIADNIKMQESQKADEAISQKARLTFEQELIKLLQDKLAAEKANNAEIERHDKVMAETKEAQAQIVAARNKAVEDTIAAQSRINKAFAEINKISGFRSLKEGQAQTAPDVIANPEKLAQVMLQLKKEIDSYGVRDFGRLRDAYVGPLKQLKAQYEIAAEAEKEMLAARTAKEDYEKRHIPELNSLLAEQTKAYEDFLKKKFPEGLKEVNAAMVGNLKSQADVLWELVVKLRKENAAGGGVPGGQIGIGRALGGWIPGSSVEGTHIRASGGEFIVPQAAAERNFPSLMAMISGRMSDGRSESTTYNQTVTVNGASNPKQSGIEVAKVLRRLNRQGNIRLT